MNRTRRELLEDSVWMGAAAFLAGCVGDGMRLCGPCGARMQGFVAPKLERARVGRKTAAPLGLVDVDIRKAGIADGVGKVEGQFTI